MALRASEFMSTRHSVLPANSRSINYVSKSFGAKAGASDTDYDNLAVSSHDHLLQLPFLYGAPSGSFVVPPVWRYACS